MSTAIKIKELTLLQAVNDGLQTMLRERNEVVILGEDVGENGGVFRATDGLQKEFGEHRVFDTPLSEAGIIGSSVGMAMNGMLPIAEIQFFGFIYPAYEQIMSQATRMRYRTKGIFTVPLVIRAPYGAGVHAPEIHSDSVESLFTHMPGIKVICPSTPYDAKGLLISAIEDPDPVLFLEPLRLYRSVRGEVPEGKYTIEIGEGKKLKEGDDVTVIAWGAMMPVAMKAAEEAERQGITCDVIDLRTLYPIDKDIIAESVQKTGRCVIVHEAHATGGLGNDIVSIINDTSFLYMKSPIERVTGADVHVPFWALEQHYLPTSARVLESIQNVINF
ncbi:alpha-ketoacid dehydrogenase subunit beta [Sporosarcina sp. ACRSM]|uniref:alpha-ketoacid dehydrogenase subunit beta n=1 Tax=Sporosarcina sp. ACRSM TaxID=2918216 RepID=UPI001EF729FB|nr:alpha-ketoacid dehydrogenase subunit beta [Sporosarcina sp. ACRSM]MCG7335763.1 alpha-ketoacid dehydrogenase subunit beta [Sporosarcina sp. ACRSM]